MLENTVNLSTYIEDISWPIRAENLHDLPSSAISMVADRTPERIATLVILDGFVPKQAA